MQPSADVQRELAGLRHTCARTSNPMLLVRAASWRNTLARVGVGVPLWLVHDVGVLFVAAPDAIGLRPEVERAPASAALRRALEGWPPILRELARTEAVERARTWRLSDALVGVLLLRVLAPLWQRLAGPGRPAAPTPMPLDPDVYRAALERLATPAAEHPDDARVLAQVVNEGAALLTAVEQVDLDTLRLLGMFGAEASAANALGVLDLLAVLGDAEANDVVNFSLDLLPSVLETKRATGAQTFAVDGYAGLARRGALDSLLLSELAFDDALFEQRFAENEVFDYAREKTHEEDRRLHYVAVDATASMRGQRSVFARGLALTLIKKVSLLGEDVFFRFFDARLYDVQVARAKGGRGERGIDVPYVLSFRGERGRHYGKVLGQLAGELERTARRERTRPILYLLTHAECHVPMDVVERLRSVATLYGVFMLPSAGELDLDWTSRLHRVQVVSADALRRRDERAARAKAILDDATARDAPEASPGGDDADLRAAEAELDASLRGGGA